MAIGHVRYSTTGGKNVNNIQPLVIRHIKGNLAVAHNGNLVNAPDLRKTFELNGGIFTARQIPSLLLILLFQPVLQVRALRRLLKR